MSKKVVMVRRVEAEYVSRLVVAVVLLKSCILLSLSVSLLSSPCQGLSNGLLGVQFGGVLESTTPFLTEQPDKF